MRVSLRLVLGLLLVSCHPPTAPPRTAPSSAPRPLETAPSAPPAPGAEAPTPVASEPPPPCHPLGYATESICTGGTPFLVGGDPARALNEDGAFAAWFAAHGGKEPNRDGETSYCETGRLADNDVLICGPVEHASRGSIERGNWLYRIIERRVIYRVEKGRTRVIFDEPIALTMLDSMDEDDGPLFGLVAELDDRGVLLREYREGSCSEARAKVSALAKDEERETARWARFDREWVDRLCRATGRYEWRNGALRRPVEQRAAASSSSW